MDRAEALMPSAPDSAMMILDSIDIDLLAGDGELNRYYVLLAQAQYKCNLDIHDSILPAARYYEGRDDPYMRMLSKYYAGMYWFEQTAHHEPDAIISLADAAALADSLHDHMYSGLINRSIAMVHQRVYDAQNEIKYFRKSLDEFTLDGSQRHIDYAKLNLAMGLLNGSCWAESVPIAREAMARGLVTDDGYLTMESMRVLARAFLKIDYPDSLIYYFDIVANKYPEQIVPDDYTFLSYAYYQLGDTRQANKFLALADTNSIKTEWFVARMLAHNGDYENAYRHLYNQYEKESSVVRDIISQTVTLSIEEHLTKQRLQSQNSLLTIKNKFWIVVTILLALLAALLFVAVYMIDKRKRQLKTAQQNIIALKTMVDDLNRTNNDATCRIQQVLRSKISIIESLLYSYYVWSDTDSDGRMSKKRRDQMYKDAIRVISDCQNTDSELYREMESNVNSHYADILTRFKSSFPDLTPQDYMLFTFSAMGFSTTTICLFLDVDTKSLYNRKYRLKTRINNSSDPSSSDYLAILS